MHFESNWDENELASFPAIFGLRRSGVCDLLSNVCIGLKYFGTNEKLLFVEGWRDFHSLLLSGLVVWILDCKVVSKVERLSYVWFWLWVWWFSFSCKVDLISIGIFVLIIIFVSSCPHDYVCPHTGFVWFTCLYLWGMYFDAGFLNENCWLRWVRHSIGFGIVFQGSSSSVTL